MKHLCGIIMGNIHCFHRPGSRYIEWKEIREQGYLVAHNKVYDAKAFIGSNVHPPCIVKKFGTDCSSDYDQHREGKKIWKQYLIGRVSK